MSQNTEFFVSKLSFREDEKLIQDVFVYEYDENGLREGDIHTREWMVNRTLNRMPISTMTKDSSGKWQRGNQFNYDGNIYSWGNVIPENLERRKTFVSYYHKDDQAHRTRFENIFGDLVISKSVELGDIDGDNSDTYVKQLIQGDYLSDTTLLVVLIGSKTKCRKHVDWEISGALDYKVGDRYSGLLGLFLPSHSSFGNSKWDPDSVPKRLQANFESGYAVARDWTDDRVEMQKNIEAALSNRSKTEAIKNREIEQMTDDVCE